jgi:hypothetical protein
MNTMKAMAVLLMFVLVCQPLIAQAQTVDENQAALKARLDQIPIGKTIEVKLLQKGNSKIKGKLISVSDDGFEIQTVKADTLSRERIAFSDVKSVKKSGMRTGTKILIGVGGFFLAMAIIVGATTGFQD